MKQCIHVAIFDCKNGYKQSQKSLPVTFVSLYYEIPLQRLHMSSGLEIRSPSLLILKRAFIAIKMNQPGLMQVY